jgi:broad specificity phosphatase PhoE
MRIFLVRHGKSDKSLKGTVSHDEFEQRRELLAESIQPAVELGKQLRELTNGLHGFDFVHSGRIRSRQTLTAISQGLGLSEGELSENMREDFDLAYVASEEYWEGCETAVANGEAANHAAFFLSHPPTQTNELTLTAEQLQTRLHAAIKRAVLRNIFYKNEVVIMVSHEPVLTLGMAYFFGVAPESFGSGFNELEYAVIDVDITQLNKPTAKITFRNQEQTIDATS